MALIHSHFHFITRPLCSPKDSFTKSWPFIHLIKWLTLLLKPQAFPPPSILRRFYRKISTVHFFYPTALIKYSPQFIFHHTFSWAFHRYFSTVDLWRLTISIKTFSPLHFSPPSELPINLSHWSIWSNDSELIFPPFHPTASPLNYIKKYQPLVISIQRPWFNLIPKTSKAAFDLFSPDFS